MDRQHFYRSLEGTHGGTLSHFANTMDSLDLNLQLAPPPAMDSSPPPFLFQPLGSGGVPNTMFNFQQVVPTPPPQPSWARFFFDAPATPPSPGEIDSGYHHDFQQSPFWGMDFSDIDSGHHLDLDLSPLLHEHFREDDDELEVALIDPEEQEEEQDERSTWWRNRSQQVSSTTGEVQLPPSSSVVATGAGPPAVAPKARQQNQSSCAKKNTSASASCGDAAEGGNAGSGQDTSKSCSCSKQEKEVFFDCNVCFDVATEPVVTSCGHLFCWPCLYQWLHVHSHNDECPVCKGAVSDADVIPIYGRGGPGGGSSLSAADIPGDIPPRPRARRTDSVRQQQYGADVLSEMLRWRAMRFMHENVERVFLSGTNSPGQRRPRRRMPERRSGVDGRPLPGPFHHGMDGVIDHQWPYSDGPGSFTPQLPDPSYHLLHSSLLHRRLPL